ncbi:MAG TPA: ABC transporter ATP-binding protein [Thermoanaerobaculia bacterium]|nr:ABC transporter ATP-binding protein [Thermoanaerobaculia bacterium]
MPEPSSDPVIAARGLGRRFGRHWALAHIQLEVDPGELVLLAGANGSGKTTLLRIIAGLIHRTRGELSVFGRDPHRQRAACRSRTCLVTHHGYLYENLTALEMVDLWNRLSPQPRDHAELLPLLDRMGLAERAHEEVQTFSAGMRKRLTLLRAELEQPELVLLDEPFSALDPAGQHFVDRWITGGLEQGKTFVIASHALARATRLGGRAVLLRRGQIAWRGPCERLAEQFQVAS